jgi:hypothetical protein
MHPTIVAIIIISILLVAVYPVGIIALNRSVAFRKTRDAERIIIGTLICCSLLYLIVGLLILISKFPGVD